MNGDGTRQKDRAETGEQAQFLAPSVIERIEQALARVGDFGEVRLIVVKGQLRFIQTLHSENLNDRSGAE